MSTKSPTHLSNKMTLPSHARVVIVGGGILGCSVAFHLAKLGWKDIVLLEQGQLTCGTTWHAAGLVGQLHGSHASTEFAKYTVELLNTIEAETGQNPGYRESGSISIAINQERLAELRRKADFASLFGIEAHYLSTQEIEQRWPLMNPEGVLGGIFMPRDGSANPIDLTMALAKGARQYGARLLEGIQVEDVLVEHNRAVGVTTKQGTIKAEVVVNCGGMWARELGQKNNIGVPLHACEHYYLVTEAIESLPQDLPVLRSYCDGTYFKEDAGKLLFGFAHNRAKPWATAGIPANFSFESLPFVEDDVMDILEQAMHRVPLLETTGIRTFFNGPESYSYDGRFTLGVAPDLPNYFILAGLNSTGIQTGPGAGRALAEWIVNGHPTLDLSSMDPGRCEKFQARDPYLRARCPETLVQTYAMHWPNYQRQTARNIRRTPFHHLLQQRGACFTETQGWERPGWFAPRGIKPEYQYSFGRQNWFEYAIAEQQAARERVAIVDYSMLGKIMIEGQDAEAFLDRICTNAMTMPVHRVAYTLLLNARGGIESDVTVARHAKHSFMMMSPIARTRRDFEYLNRLVGPEEDVRLRDATTSYGVIGLMGPQSRALLASVTEIDVSNEAFPFNTLRKCHIGHAEVIAQRLSYSGELGWEIFVTPDVAEHVLEELLTAGNPFGLQLLGAEALNALRLEKGFLHWGHDMAYTEAPHQVGLEFTCKTKSDRNFIGRDAYLRRKAEGDGPYLCSIKLQDSVSLMHHNEPVLRDGDVVGYVTSGAYSAHFQCSVGLGFIEPPKGVCNKAALTPGNYSVMIEGQAIPAEVSTQPFYDVNNERMLS
jgi:glycine cleavage system aminomethyltransferase T/glycine/D-amino acid oxidase-like deaminating enzyme